MKRFACQHCSEKFKYRYQLTRHENRSHKQRSHDAATSATVPASSEGEIDCSVVKFCIWTLTYLLNILLLLVVSNILRCVV